MMIDFNKTLLKFGCIIISLILISGCTTKQRRQEIFKQNAVFWIGKDASVLEDTSYASIEQLDKTLIYHYQSQQCKTAYVVDIKSNKIIDWYYESTEEHCAVGYPWGNAW